MLCRDRGIISQEVKDLIQQTLDEYGSGVNIVRVNFDKADPPQEVIDAFREVQAARQERSTLQNRADAYANQTLAAARGDGAQKLQEAEGYRAQVVNAAQGEASRFTAVQQQYVKAPEVTRKRLYLETMEGVLADTQTFLLDTPNAGGPGRRALPAAERAAPAGAAAAPPARGDQVMRRLPILVGLLVVAGFLLLNAIFTVDARQKAMVLQFGQVKAIKENPGLAFKVPFVQNVVFYDSRIQGLDTNALEVTPLDDRRLIVDAFARWRIADVEQFRRAVGVGGMNAASQRLEQILNANVREALGSVRSEAVLSADRVGLMNRIRDASIIEARDLGIEIIDVRLKRADLPEQNLTADLRAHEGRARARGGGRARPRQRGRAARARAGRPDRARDRLRGRPRRPGRSAARPTPSATASSPRPTAPTRSSSPSCARWTPTRTR